MQIQFHNDKTEWVGEHVIRVPRDGNVGDVLLEVRKRLGQEYEGRQLRLLEVSQNKIYKVSSYVFDLGGMQGVRCRRRASTNCLRVPVSGVGMDEQTQCTRWSGCNQAAAHAQSQGTHMSLRHDSLGKWAT